MEVMHLDKTCLYEALAKECNSDHDGADCWQNQIAIGCPFVPEDDGRDLCQSVTPEDWRKVFKDKEEPQFQFGDKVTVEGIRAVFVFYGKTLADTAEVIFEGSYATFTAAMDKIKAGWL